MLEAMANSPANLRYSISGRGKVPPLGQGHLNWMDSTTSLFPKTISVIAVSHLTRSRHTKTISFTGCRFDLAQLANAEATGAFARRGLHLQHHVGTKQCATLLASIFP
jgi:hypothetical protein